MVARDDVCRRSIGGIDGLLLFDSDGLLLEAGRMANRHGHGILERA